jgi:hypothetical protein
VGALVASTDFFVIRKTFGRPGNQKSSGSRPTAPNRLSTMDDPGRVPRVHGTLLPDFVG